MAKLWMVIGFLVLSTLARASDADIKPPAAPFRAPDDRSEYRHLVLENGLRVLLCSDPDISVASAAVAVDAGYYDDPPTRPGLAHYVEHLLFLGSEKYPEESGFERTVKASGGSNNGETRSDCTVYRFTVPHGAFDEPLDQMAQFFIAPRFDLSTAERELTAIENEFERHRDDDGARRHFVSLELYDPASPASRFPIGNRATLAGTTRDEVVAFYQARYSADHMAVALYGPQPLDRLEALARAGFSAVPRRPVAARPPAPSALSAKAACRFAQIVSSGEQSRLFLEFPIGATRQYVDSKPAELVAALFTAPGPGSLLERLRAEGLALGCGAAVEHQSADHSSLCLSIPLTAAGRARPERVLQLVFARCERLRASPLPSSYFKEQLFLTTKKEAFMPGADAAKRLATLATAALHHPLELAEWASRIWHEPDDETCQQVLAALRPDNVLVYLVAPGVPADRKERYYGFDYSYAELTGEALQPITPTAADIAASLPPEPNPFIDDTVHLLGQRPIRIIDEPGLTLYHVGDGKQRRPLVAYRFVIHPGTGTLNSQQLCRLVLYQGSIEIGFTAADQALAAGITLDCQATADGLVVSVSGFSGGTERFLERLFARMAQPDVTDVAFRQTREHLVNLAQDAIRAEALDLAQMRLAGLVNSPSISIVDLAAPARRTTREEVLAAPHTLFGRCHIEAIACGNVYPDEAARLARLLRDQLRARPASPKKVVRSRFLQLPAGATVVDATTVPGTNSAVRITYLAGADTHELRAALALVGCYIEGDFYADLRTRQQLGYRVATGVAGEPRFLGLVGDVQSAEHASDVLRDRVEAYFSDLPRRWAAVTPEQFETFRAGARSSFEGKSVDLAKTAEQFWDLTYTYNRDWDRDSKIRESLDALTPERVGQIITELVTPATRRLIVVQLTAKDHVLKTPPVPTFTDREAWKRTRTYR